MVPSLEINIMKKMKMNLFVMLLSLAILSGSCGNKKTGEPGNVNAASSAEPVMDSKMMIIAKLSVKPEKAKDFTEAAKGMIENSNKESGCIFYQLFQDPYDNSKFVFVEEYKNQAAVDAHFEADYFKAFGPEIGDFILGQPEIKIITVGKEVIK
jgi:quinol monooxygenase YgiN